MLRVEREKYEVIFTYAPGIPGISRAIQCFSKQSRTGKSCIRSNRNVRRPGVIGRGGLGSGLGFLDVGGSLGCIGVGGQCLATGLFLIFAFFISFWLRSPDVFAEFMHVD